MRITRVYSDANGESHFEDVEILLEDAGEIGRLSERFPASGIIFREMMRIMIMIGTRPGAAVYHYAGWRN